LGFNFGKQEDAHRLERKKDNLDKDVNDPSQTTEITPSKKRKRHKAEESDSEDLGLPKVKTKSRSPAHTLILASEPDSDLKFPIFWSEVYAEGKWIPIDAMVLKIIAQTPKDIEKFEPKGQMAEEKKLVMGYVVAYDAGTSPEVNYR
jgi:hypothetical protein